MINLPDSDRDRADEKLEIAWQFWGWLGLIIVLVLAAPWVVWAYMKIAPGPNEAGPFGDQYGAINALFSGLAFWGVIIAMVMQSRQLKLQKNELRLQREELAQTRETLEGQKQQFVAQVAEARRQTVESSFYQLLRRLDAQRNAILISRGNGKTTAGQYGTNSVIEGSGAFQFVRAAIDSAVNKGESWFSKFATEPAGRMFLSYLRTVQVILDFIELQEVNETDENDDVVSHFAGILRSQLTSDEMLVIRLFADHVDGWQHLNRLRVRYQIRDARSDKSTPATIKN